MSDNEKNKGESQSKFKMEDDVSSIIQAAKNMFDNYERQGYFERTVQISHELIESLNNNMWSSTRSLTEGLGSSLIDISNSAQYLLADDMANRLILLSENIFDASRLSLPLMNVQDAVQKRLSSITENTLNSIDRVYFNINSNLIETMQNLAIDRLTIEVSIKENLKKFNEINWSEIIGNEDLESFYTEDTLNDLLDINESVSFQQKIIDFFNKIKHKHPLVISLCITLIWSPIQTAIDESILNLLRGTATEIINNSDTIDYRVIEKNINTEVNNVININIESDELKRNIIKYYRYVSNDELAIRQNNCINSKLLHTLEFGQVVKVIRKNKNWTLIEYENEEKIIEGWVLTRYITKLKN